jgi:hypothetical protein
VNENLWKRLVRAIVSLMKPAKFSKNVLDKVESRGAWNIDDFWGVVEEQGDYYKGMVEAESSAKSADGGASGPKKPVGDKKKNNGQGRCSSGKPAGMADGNGSHEGCKVSQCPLLDWCPSMRFR